MQNGRPKIFLVGGGELPVWQNVLWTPNHNLLMKLFLYPFRISMETAGLPIPGYHYIAPSAIVKTPIH